LQLTQITDKFADYEKYAKKLLSLLKSA
jgi:hypothetical protein